MDFQRLRNKMIKEQILARGITNEDVLEALRRVPRHEFVPEGSKDLAYNDCPVAIGEGQTVSQPYMVALMTQCLDLDKSKRVLEIGTGSGYQTAVLAELCKEVCSIERLEILVNRARKKLAELHYTNIELVCGDGSLGWPKFPRDFDGIMITAGSPGRLDHLFSQLNVDGKLVVPIGDRFGQVLKVFTKLQDQIQEEPVCGCTFVPLIGKYGWPEN